MGDQNLKVYDGVLFNTETDYDESEELVGRRNLKMNDSDIWSHSHRMYLIGENSISFPWYIPKDFPSKALDPAHKERFLRYLKMKQLVLDWSETQKNSYLFFRIFYPPLASTIHKAMRTRHFNALQDGIYESFDTGFWDER